jgi:hypothetical protein
MPRKVATSALFLQASGKQVGLSFTIVRGLRNSDMALHIWPLHFMSIVMDTLDAQAEVPWLQFGGDDDDAPPMFCIQSRE